MFLFIFEISEECEKKENKDSTDSDLPLKLTQTNKPRRSGRNEQFQLSSRRTHKEGI